MFPKIYVKFRVHSIETSPSTVLCFSPFVKKSVMQNFNLTLIQLINVDEWTIFPKSSFEDFKQEAFYRLNTDFNMSFGGIYAEETPLKLGINIIDNIQINIEELFTLNYGICNKISGRIVEGVISIHLNKSMQLNYGSDMTIPYIYVTSEDNSYGILDTTWRNGGEIRFAFYNLIPYPGAFNIFKLKTIKNKYNGKKGTCSQGDHFNKCLVKTILEGNYTCTKHCLPLSLPKFDQVEYLPQCQSWEEYGCMKGEIEEKIDGIKNICPSACETVEYVGNVLHNVYLNSPVFRWTYDIRQQMVVYEEYVVYDFAGFISSVGGMLGLFIGFSFLDFILSGIQFLTKKITK